MSINNSDEAKNALRDLGDKGFSTQNIHYISSIENLAEHLRHMRDDVYAYHVGQHHNHFSDWISQVVGDEELAGQIFSASRNQAADIIHARVSWLKTLANSP